MGVCCSKGCVSSSRVEEIMKTTENKPPMIWLSPPLIKYKKTEPTTCPLCIGDVNNDQMVYRCPFCIVSIHEYCFIQLVNSFEAEILNKPLCPCCRRDWSENCLKI